MSLWRKKFQAKRRSWLNVILAGVLSAFLVLPAFGQAIGPISQGQPASLGNTKFVQSACVQRVAGTDFGCISAGLDANWIYMSGSPAGASSVGWRINNSNTNGYGLYIDTSNLYVGGAIETTDVYATGLRGNTGVSNIINLHPAAGINLYAQSSGVVTANVGGNGVIGGHILLAPNVSTTGVGNVGASGPDDLQTYQIPASGFNISGACFRISAKGTTANNANAKTVRLVFGATTLVTKQLTASIAGRWSLSATVCRTGASAQDYFAEAINYGGTTVSSTDGDTVAMLSGAGTSTETETAAIDIKVQSTVSTANNDIVSELLIVEYL